MTEQKLTMNALRITGMLLVAAIFSACSPSASVQGKYVKTVSDDHSDYQWNSLEFQSNGVVVINDGEYRFTFRIEKGVVIIKAGFTERIGEISGDKITIDRDVYEKAKLTSNAKPGWHLEQASPLTKTSTPAPVSEEKIKGAFGKNFGDVFEPSSAIAKDTLNDGTLIYEFAPDKVFRLFTKYQVLITPKTHRIYSIRAEGSVEDVQAGRKEQALITELLKEKYGEPEPYDGLVLGDEVEYFQGNCLIDIDVKDNLQPIIRIWYGNSTYRKLAESERDELVKKEAKKLDNSGL